MLTVSTPIPTSLRGKIRALVKAHASWHGFLGEKGMLSASARNADLLEFALRHPTLANWIEQMLRSFSEDARRASEELADYEATQPSESANTLILARQVEKLLAAYARRIKDAQPKPRVRISMTRVPI